MSDPELDALFAKPGRWHEARRALRALLLDCPVEEALKWGQPCYIAQGRNVAILGTYKDAVVLSFLSGALLADPDGLLAPPGPNSRSARVMRFDSAAAIMAQAEVIRGFVQAAVANAAAGLRVDMPADDFALPDELTEALAADPDLSAAWDALTPGRRRGWALHFAQPKNSATRVARVEKAISRILEEKGIHDR